MCTRPEQGRVVPRVRHHRATGQLTHVGGCRTSCVDTYGAASSGHRRRWEHTRGCDLPSSLSRPNFTQKAALTGVCERTSAHGDSSLSRYDSGTGCFVATNWLGEGVGLLPPPPVGPSAHWAPAGEAEVPTFAKPFAKCVWVGICCRVSLPKAAHYSAQIFGLFGLPSDLEIQFLTSLVADDS